MKFDVSVEQDRAEVIVHTPRGDVRVTITDYATGIGFEGHGTKLTKDGVMEEVVMLFYENDQPFPILIVWGDINREDPTIVLPLRDSVESNREDR